MLEKFIPNHLHLICKGEFLNPPRTEKELNSWFANLVEKVRMKVVAGPISVYVKEPGNEGITGTVTLATSHASMHVWDAEIPSLFQFDIYSCSEFSTGEIIEELNKFDLNYIEYLKIDRNNNLEIIEKNSINF